MEEARTSWSCCSGVVCLVSRALFCIGSGGLPRGSSRVLDVEVLVTNLKTSKESGFSEVAAVIPK